MAATAQWLIDEYLGARFASELEQIPVTVVDVSDPNFCLADTDGGQRINIPWQQMFNGFYQRLPDTL